MPTLPCQKPVVWHSDLLFWLLPHRNVAPWVRGFRGLHLSGPCKNEHIQADACCRYFRYLHVTSELPEGTNKRVIRCCFQLPSVEKMDASSTLMSFVMAMIDIVSLLHVSLLVCPVSMYWSNDMHHLATLPAPQGHHPHLPK